MCSPFGELLLLHRVAAGLSQRQLAERSGVSERAVRDLERGAVAAPRMSSVRALATALGLTGDDASAFSAAAVARPRRAAATTIGPIPTDLVGRQDELRALADLVTARRHRIITVTGPAGVGKSRLVAALVTIVRNRTPLTVYTVDLSGLGEPGLVGEVVAEAIGRPGSWRSSPVDRVAAELRGRTALLVVDCFERLVDAAPVLAELVRRCPGLTVLTTSQRPLNLAGERRLPLGSLPLADAVELFVRRATASVPDFTRSPENAEAIRSICAAVDGLPLAVELAAARMRVLTPSELAARLDRPLQVLIGGSRDAPDRHRSLRAAIESSLDLVGDKARTLLARLAPFAGGVRLTDLEQVAGGEGWVVEALLELVDAGLVRVRDNGTRSVYLLPDAVRQMAAELLAARDDDAAVRERIARHYLHRLRAAAMTADGQGFADLDPELDDVRAAVDWARRHQPAALDVATVQALYRFHDVRGRYGEGRSTLIRLAEAGPASAAWALVGAANFSRLLKDVSAAEDLVGQAEALLSRDDGTGHEHSTRAAAALLRGNLATDRGDLRAAIAHNAAAAQAARCAGDALTLGRVLNNLGAVEVVLGELADAERHYRESLVVRRRAGAPDRDLGLTLMNLADLDRANRRWSAAIRRAREAADLLERAGHPRARGMALATLAMAALRGGTGGDLDTAATAIEEAVVLLPAFGDDKPWRAIVDARRSVVMQARGHAEEVYPVLAEAVEAMLDTLSQFEIAPILEAHAALLARRDAVAAARLLGLAEAVRDDQAHPQPALLQPASRTAKVCRARLGPSEYAQAHRFGSALYRHGLPDALAELFAPHAS